MGPSFRHGLALTFVSLLGCGPARGNLANTSAACMAGAQQPCSCDDGSEGTATCGLDLQWGACACSDAGAGIDATVPDVPLPNTDIPASIDRVSPPVDAGSQVDTGVAPGQLGSGCARLSDCPSGVCLPSSRCSRTCAGPADCPTAIGWTCTSLPGLGPVCDCNPRGAEACNGLDDNCNGVADEGFDRCGGACVSLSSDDNNCGRCGVRCGGGTRCVGGVCACPAGQPLACGGACVDPNADPSHCGGCGRACSASQRCSAGSCVNAGPTCPSFCSVSSDCSPCRGAGDPAGTSWCCNSGMCLLTEGTCGLSDAGLVDVRLPDVDLNDVNLFPDLNLLD